MRRVMPLVKPFAVLPLAACLTATAPEPAPRDDSPSPTVQRTSAHFGSPTLAALAPGVATPAPPPPEASPFEGPESHVDALMPDIAVTVDTTRGQAFQAALDALPPERAELGVQGLTLSAFEGLCENVQLNFQGTDGNGPWTLTLDVERGVWATAPQRYLVPLPQACIDDLLANGGTAGAAACLDTDRAAFYPSGSDCETCLDVDGDYDRCVQEAQCPLEATRRVEASNPITGSMAMYSVVAVDSLSCAPAHDEPFYLLVRYLDETDPLPGVYEHGKYEHACVEHWSDASNSLQLYCSSTISPIGNVLLDVLPVRILEVDQAGTPPHRRRMAAPASVTLDDGRRYDLAIGFEIPLAVISAELGLGGWGMPPLALRPGGTDPTNVDHTYARDWLASLALKTTTTIDGIAVWPFNRNRCLEWSEPEADGSRTCRKVDEWDFSGDWSDDGMVSWFDYDAGTSYIFPFTTLVSTGLPDPEIPGGIALHVVPSETLARIEGDACGWPETFVPDRMRLLDTNPPNTDAPYASFDGETWNFDRTEWDIRVGLATNQYRGFCPE